MEASQYLNSAITVVVTMLVTILVRAIIDWAKNKNGKTAISDLTTELRTLKEDYNHFKSEYTNLNIKLSEFITQFKTFENDYQKSKLDDLNFKNKFLQDFNLFKYEYTSKKDYDSHINTCGLRVEEYKESLYGIKQDLAMLTQRVANIEK